MKKIFLLVVTAILISLILCSCGNRAIIYAPNGAKIAEGAVTNWKDYDDSDQLQVCINGKTYLTAAENIVLIAD